jgi:exodeoxyribonuclease V
MTTATADRRLSRSDLSPDQRSVYESMLDWIKTPSRPLLTVGGVAGSGKSTLLGVFAHEMSHLRVAYICFTGRASSVLQRKLTACGISTTGRSCTDSDDKLDGPWGHLFYSPDSDEAQKPFCGTIHRILYRPIINSVTEELMGWEKRTELDRNYDLIILDEASMVSAGIVEDLNQHGARILAVGDHGQLPPVMSEGSLVSRPMLRLEKIHRQAADNPIIQLSRVLREEGRLDRSLADGVRLRFGEKRDLTHPRLAEMLTENKLDAAVLCWRNATRVHVNRTVRGHLGYSGKPPQVGEPLVALRNHAPIFNGMRGLVTEEATSPFKDEWWLMKTKIKFPDDGLSETGQEVCRDQFHRPRPFESIEELKKSGIHVHSMGQAGHLYDFAYAMTVHKFQGSSVRHAVVVADWKPDYSNENTRRLAYTAVTRASERLTVLT